MASDLVFPGNNEEDFVEMAERLGYSKLYFVYDGKSDKKYESKSKDMKICSVVVAEPKNILAAKKRSDFVIVKSSADDRNVIEALRPSLIFDFETVERKDFIHHRNSGLNHVHCSLMAKNGISIGFSLKTLLSPSRLTTAQLLGRIAQNIRFCRKFKVNMIFASFAASPYDMRSPHDIKALAIMLGMTPKEANDSVEF